MGLVLGPFLAKRRWSYPSPTGQAAGLVGDDLMAHSLLTLRRVSSAQPALGTLGEGGQPGVPAVDTLFSKCVLQPRFLAVQAHGSFQGVENRP